MAHVLELAVSGRSKCRGCAQLIRRGQVRFGERLPNLFGEGEMTLWFHPVCAAYKRPEPFLQIIGDSLESPAPALLGSDREGLERAARDGVTYRRLRRIDGVERSPTGQARCRCCREPILKGTWRIRLVYHEEGRFSPGGYVHLTCREAYFETGAVWDRLLHFSPDLSAGEREQLRLEYDSGDAA